MTKFLRATALLLALLLGGGAFAQFRSRSSRSQQIPIDNPRAGQNSVPTPEWKYEPGFEKDVFTFVRIRYSAPGRRRSNGIFFGNERWAIDYPDADLNFAYRLQQMTSMKVDPNGKVLEITDPQLFRYPWIYIVEPGDLEFTDEEVPILRRYLLNGGFLMVDDFWGEDEWENFAEQMSRVFPDRQFFDIPRSHPIFHTVFELPEDLNLQCPNIRTGTTSQYDGVTWERPDAMEVHIRGINDDKGRLCVVACHNTDNGDGWEREGESRN